MKPKSLYRAALLEYLFYASLTADPAEASAAYRSYRQLARKGCPASTATVSKQTPQKPKNITAVPPKTATPKHRKP